MLSDSQRRRLREAILNEVPEQPGVYTWRGESGEPLYVGKSVNLRRRMLSYLAIEQSGPRKRKRHLAFAIHSFEHRPTAGELLALLLEDALIKQLSPRHNVRQRDYLERRYLLLTHDPYPTCLVVEAEPPRPGTLYGPFKDRYFVDGLVQLINDEFGLRACPDRHPVRRSARFDLGACPGPCRGEILEYDLVVDRTSTFLGGDETWLEDRLNAEMERASAALEFERAAKAKGRLAFCRRFTARQRFIREFREGAMLIQEPALGLDHHFDRGQLTDIRDAAGSSVPLPAELRRPADDPRFVLDRANLVYAWLRRQTPRPDETWPLGAGRPRSDR